MLATATPGTDADRGDNPLVRYLTALYGRVENGQVELRHRPIGGGKMQQRFYRPAALIRGDATIRQLALRNDLWIGVAPRTARAGDLSAVAPCWAAWIDCDGDTAALDAFAIAPSIQVASGSGPGHMHAYWLLDRPLQPTELTTLNRRLAHAAGGDLQATDAARILRPPMTLNHKHDPPRPVTLEQLTGTRHDPERLAAELPELDEHEAQAVARATTGGQPRDSDDPLLAIPPPVYVAHLVGQQPDREGKVSCPFHSDSTPSLHVYRQPERGWSCFGCGRGGSIYDLAGELWGLDTRGREFLQLRQRLTRELVDGTGAA